MRIKKKRKPIGILLKTLKTQKKKYKTRQYLFKTGKTGRPITARCALLSTGDILPNGGLHSDPHNPQCTRRL